MVVEKNCNQKCLFCSAFWRDYKYNFRELVKEILQKWDYIQISWWEPLLNKDIFKIVAVIKKYKPKSFLEFQTNWILLTENENYLKLIKLGVNLFNINYPSHISEIDEAIVKLKFAKVKREEWIKKLIEFWWKIRLTIIINKLNYNNLEETIEYINTNFKWIEKIQFSYIKIMWLSLYNSNIIPKYEQVSSHLINSLKKCKKYWINVEVDHIPICFLWWFEDLHVDYKKIRNKLKWEYNEEKKKIQKCFECIKKDYCSWFRIDYLDFFNLYDL